MTETAASTPASPKKSYKNLFVVIALILGALSINHFTIKLGYGVEATITDSTIVVAPVVDTISVVAPVVDTTKTDSTKK